MNQQIAEMGWPVFGQSNCGLGLCQGIVDPEQMTNFPKNERNRLGEQFDFATANIARRQNSTDGTVKLLLQWNGVNR